MREEKKSGLEIVVIFLSILVVLLFGYIIYDKIFNTKGVSTVDDETKLLDLTKVNDYINYNGTYATMKKLVFESKDGDIYNLNLGMDGRVYLHDYDARIYISNIKNVVDIIALKSENNDINYDKCYMLTDDGRVYLYRISDMLSKKYEVELVEDVSNVDRLINYYYADSEGASSSWGIIAILENGTYVQLSNTNG